MGKIEDSILENYKKALSDGNISQAKKSVELAGVLKNMVESQNFTDYEDRISSSTVIISTFYEPFLYSYNSKYGIVKINKSIINLTKSENKIFYLFSLNETFGTNIKIVRNYDIKSFVWPDKSVSHGAIRILLKRLRRKIEPNPDKPQIIISFNKKGYIFVAKKLHESQ